MLRSVSALRLLALLLLLSMSSAVENNATESVSPQLVPETQDPPTDEDTNQARNRGRRPSDSLRHGESKWLKLNNVIENIIKYYVTVIQLKLKRKNPSLE